MRAASQLAGLVAGAALVASLAACGGHDGSSRLAPRALAHIPEDLKRARTSGIYADGWLQRKASVELAGGPAALLTVKALVARAPTPRQNVSLFVNGERVGAQEVPPGHLALSVPIPSSHHRRQIVVRWASAAPISPQDHREAAALLQFVGLTAQSAPTAISRTTLNQEESFIDGVSPDGWLSPNSRFLLAGEGPATLTIRASVPKAAGQHLSVRTNGQTIYSESVRPGNLDLQLGLPAAAGPRTVSLAFAKAVRLRPPDTRRASALLDSISVAQQPNPPGRITREGLGRWSDFTTGVYKDGWLQKRATITLEGGGAALLQLNVLVPSQGEQLTVSVGRTEVADRRAVAGELKLRVPLGPSDGPRRIKLAWSTAARISPQDPRTASALLRSISVAARPPAPTSLSPPFASGQARYVTGMFADGWIGKHASATLAGGSAAHLELQALVVVPGQHLVIAVNGSEVADQAVPHGDIKLNVGVPPSAGPRTIAMTWSTATRISPKDPRIAAALLRTIAITDSPGEILR